jgi:hypothetical protein
MNNISKLASQLGKLGGIAFRERYGKDKYSEMGKKGMAKRWAGHVKQGRKKRTTTNKEGRSQVVPKSETIGETKTVQVDPPIRVPSSTRSFLPYGTIIRRGSQTWIADGKGGVIVKND